MKLKHTKNTIFAAATIIAVSSANAATRTKASTGTDLTNAASWDTLPGSGDVAAWNSQSAVAGLTVNSDVFWDSMTFTALSGNLDISGSGSITLGKTAAGVIFAGSGNSSISNELKLTLGGATSVPQGTGSTTNRLEISTGGNLTLGAITANGTATANDANVMLRGVGTTTVNGVFTVDGQFYKGDTGTVILNNTNSFGWIHFNNGKLLAGTDGAFGTGTIWLATGGGTLTLASKDSNARSLTNALTFQTNANFGQTTGGTGALSFSGLVDLGTSVKTITTDANTSFSNTVSGLLGGIIKGGNATLTLSGANTYTGATTLNAGTLQFAKTASFYNNTVDGTTAAKLTVNSGATAAFSVGGAGEFTEANINTILAASTGTVGFKTGSILGLDTTNGDFNYASNLVNPTGSTSLGLTKLGANTLTLSGTNGYTGATLVSGGTLKAGIANAFGTNSAVTLANTAGVSLDLGGFDVTIGSLAGGGTTGGNVNLGAKRLLVGGNNVTTTFDGVISGTLGGISKTGAGTLTLSNANTYTGQTTLSGGVLAVGTDTSLGSGTLRIEGGATLASSGASSRTLANFVDFAATSTFGTATTGNLKFTNTLALGAGTKTLTVNNAITEFSGNVTGSGTNTITKSGAGTLLFSGTYSAGRPLTVDAGTLKAGVNNAFGSAAITVAGGKLDTTGFTVANDVSITANAAITGTYSGSVNTGTSAARAINTTGGFNVTTLTGQGTFSGGLVSVTGAHSPGNSPGSETFNNGLTYVNASTAVTMELAGLGGVAGTDYDFINVVGALGLNGILDIVSFGGFDLNQNGTYNLFDADTFSGDFAIVKVAGNNLTFSNEIWSGTFGSNAYNFSELDGVLDITVVPEPTTALLGCLGLLALLRRRRG